MLRNFDVPAGTYRYHTLQRQLAATMVDRCPTALATTGTGMTLQVTVAVVTTVTAVKF